MRLTPATIVGVAPDTRNRGLDREVNPEIYAPSLQNPKFVAQMNLAVKVASGQNNSNSVAARRFQMQLLGAFAGLALVITTIGIYGVISYAVSQRTHEIGVRMALGAQRSDVLRMVIWRGMRLTLVGVALGLAAALALTRIMKNLLFEVSATDPSTFALIALLLVAVALIGSYIPARRAAKVDPLLAIRNE